MLIREESVNHYCDMIRRDEPFSFAGYSDAEWYCILGKEDGRLTGLGQTISSEHGHKLAHVIRRRWRDGQFLFAVPKCLWPHEGPKPDPAHPNLPGPYQSGFPGFDEGQIDWWLGSQGVDLVGYERDMVLDDLARDGGLFPWVREFSKHRVCMIGPKELRAIKPFIHYSYFVEIPSPNLHMIPDRIQQAIDEAKGYGSTKEGIIYSVSAGVSAAIIIDGLHDLAMENKSWCLDMGSVWDAFVGIGGQRQWRADLYKNIARYQQWLDWCVRGKPKGRN